MAFTLLLKKQLNVALYRRPGLPYGEVNKLPYGEVNKLPYGEINKLLRFARNDRHCEARSAEAIQNFGGVVQHLIVGGIKRYCGAAFFAVYLLIAVASMEVQASDMLLPIRLIDGHTAGVLSRGSFDADIRVYSPTPISVHGAGLIVGARVGVTNRLTIGLSYGGEGLVGYSDQVRWNTYPGVAAKYRLFEEKFATPALTLGFDNQGYGGCADELPYGYSGYVYKSPGFFVALSKNYIMLNTVQIGFHGVVNYSLEEVNNVTWPNALGGIDIGVNEELMFIVEYDFALDDITGMGDKRYALPWRGFLNMGLRWAFMENFHLEFDVRDIFENKTRRVVAIDGVYRVPIGWSRELRIIYITTF